MKLGKIVRYLVVSKTWPVKKCADGKLKSNILNPVTLVINMLYIVAIISVIYFSAITEIRFEKLSHVIDSFVMPIFSGFGVFPFFQALLTVSVSRLDTNILNSTANLSTCSVMTVFLVLFLFTTSMISFQIRLVKFKTDLTDAEQLFAWIGLIFVDCFHIYIEFGLLFFFTLCCTLLKDKLVEVNSQNSLNQGDLKSITHCANLVNAALDLTCPPIFFVLQVAIISAMYLVIVNMKVTFPFSSVIFCLCLLIFVNDFLNKLDECYILAESISCRAKEELAGCKSMSEVLAMQAAITELESCFPFTAMRYFSLERSTLISLAANTLTYIIVLVQFGME